VWTMFKIYKLVRIHETTCASPFKFAIIKVEVTAHLNANLFEIHCNPTEVLRLKYLDLA